MLFTGDIEQETETTLVNEYENTDILRSTVLKVAHHGSKTSSTDEFLQLVQPQIALIGVGKDNRYGHPNTNVLERLENINCKIYRTDENGEIFLWVHNNGKVKIKTIM
jgi:competence protein ComEC